MLYKGGAASTPKTVPAPVCVAPRLWSEMAWCGGGLSVELAEPVPCCVVGLNKDQAGSNECTDAAGAAGVGTDDSSNAVGNGNAAGAGSLYCGGGRVGGGG